MRYVVNLRALGLNIRTLRGNRTIKNEAKEKPRVGNIRFYRHQPTRRQALNILHRTAKTCTSTPSWPTTFYSPRQLFDNSSLQVLFERECWPRGAYHIPSAAQHLQSHLNEFVCHFNRRSPRHTGFGSLFEIAFRPRPISHSLLTRPGIETKAAAIDRRSSSCRIFALWLLDHRPGEFVAPVRTREFARLCVFHVLTTGSTIEGYN